jgi:hypothetical protein
MNRKDIEKVAFDYAYKEWAGGGFECASQDSFIAGAEWRINSVWHDKSEIPDLSQDILIIFKNEICTILIGAVHTLSELKHYDYTNWAYVKDLLPIKEGEK